MPFDPTMLSKLCPQLPNATAWGAALSEAAEEFDIDTPSEQAMWLANLVYESRGFTHLEENLSYSARRLAQVWPHRFAVGGEAESGPNARAFQLAHRPEALANVVYADRSDLGNGPTFTGDGWHYRGRYPCQLTGRNNYEACADAIGVPDLLDPDELLGHIEGMARVCGWYWHYRGFGALAKEGNLEKVVHRWVGYRGSGQHESVPRRELIYRNAMGALGALA